MRDQIINALKTHALGQIEKHKMNIEIYLTNPVGIGEHPDVMEAMERELSEISKYHDQLEVLKEYMYLINRSNFLQFVNRRNWKCRF